MKEPHTPHGHTPISSPQWFVAVVERGAGGGGLAASLARSGLALAPPRARNEYYAKKSGEYLTYIGYAPVGLISHFIEPNLLASATANPSTGPPSSSSTQQLLLLLAEHGASVGRSQ